MPERNSGGARREANQWAVLLAMLGGIILAGAFAYWLTTGTIWGAILAGAIVCPIFALVAGMLVVWRYEG